MWSASVRSVASAASGSSQNVALADCASLVAPASSPPRIRISGLGSFRQQVVFAQLQPSDDLDRVAALVRGAHQIFDARGLSPCGFSLGFGALACSALFAALIGDLVLLPAMIERVVGRTERSERLRLKRLRDTKRL